MAKYRKKPVVIEAFQYDGDLKGSDGKYYVPEWAVKAFEEKTMFFDGADLIAHQLNCLLKRLKVFIMLL